MQKITAVVCFVGISIALSAQVTSDSHPECRDKFYFYWGYNRSFYSRTNLHFRGPSYDFTLYQLSGSDRPSAFGTEYVKPATITVPQYNFRFGYYITKNLVISGGMDHMKYVVDAGQMTRISGVISPEASQKYAGSYLNQPIRLTSDLLKFEHTNGYNLSTIDLEYILLIYNFQKIKLKLHWINGIGGIWVVTKTDVAVFGDGFDNDFHIAGYAGSLKTGPRIEFRDRWFLVSELKAGYSSLHSVLIRNEAPELGDHNLNFLEFYTCAGYLFHAKKKSKH